MQQLKLGVIGFGTRARHMVDVIMRTDTGVQLTAVADPQAEKLSALYGNSDTRFYLDADEMLASEKFDGVVVGTRCGLHATMAVKVLAYGIPLFLEKPVATNMHDLLALKHAATSQVVVSYPLRCSVLLASVDKMIKEGRIGRVEHVQSVCDIPYGSVYYQNWYRDENETQGMFLQKACHDFDYINHLLRPNNPLWISAMASKQVFRGNHPAGLHCMDCDERLTCRESPYYPGRHSPLALDQPASEMCAFAIDTGNEDSGSALIQYDTGMHVSYSQNFYSRAKAARRGSRLIGYDGTIEFDWFTETVNVMDHRTDNVEKLEFSTNNGHGGGDEVLAANFLSVMRDEGESMSPLDEALTIDLMCLQARVSARERRFMPIEFPDQGVVQSIDSPARHLALV